MSCCTSCSGNTGPCGGSVQGYGPGMGATVQPLLFGQSLPAQPGSAPTSQEQANDAVQQGLWTLGGAFALYYMGIPSKYLIWGGIGIYSAMIYRTYNASQQAAAAAKQVGSV